MPTYYRKQGYYKPGDNYCICDVCGMKTRASDIRKRWDNALVCKADYEERHPQELIRVRGDDAVPVVQRPERTDTFIDVTDVTAEGL